MTKRYSRKKRGKNSSIQHQARNELSLSLSLSLAFENTNTARGFVASPLAGLGRNKRRSFGFLALLVSPVIYTCWLRLDFHSFVLFVLVLRAHCRVGSRSAISSRCLLPPPSAENGSTIFHKMSGNKNSGEGRTVQRMKLYSNDVRTLFPILFSDRQTKHLMESTNGRAAYMEEESVVRAKCPRLPVFKALLKEYLLLV